jgi:hypothetical protein
MRSAKSRVPHRTGWGTFGLNQNITVRLALLDSIYDCALALGEMTRRTAPTLLVIVWSIFR